MNALYALKETEKFWKTVGDNTRDPNFRVGRVHFLSKDVIHVETFHSGSIFYTLVGDKGVSNITTYDSLVSIDPDKIKSASEDDDKRYILDNFLEDAAKLYASYLKDQEAHRLASVPHGTFDKNREGVLG